MNHESSVSPSSFAPSLDCICDGDRGSRQPALTHVALVGCSTRRALLLRSVFQQHNGDTGTRPQRPRFNGSTRRRLDEPINSRLRPMSSLRVQAISRTFGSQCTSVPPPEAQAGPAWFGDQESSTRLQNWNLTSGISSTMAGAFGGSSNRSCAGDCSSCLPFSRPENGSLEGRAKERLRRQEMWSESFRDSGHKWRVETLIFPWSRWLLKRCAGAVAELIRKGMPNRAPSSVAAAAETKSERSRRLVPVTAADPHTEAAPRRAPNVLPIVAAVQPDAHSLAVTTTAPQARPRSRSNVIRSSLATQDRRPPMSSPQAGTNRNGLTERRWFPDTTCPIRVRVGL